MGATLVGKVAATWGKRLSDNGFRVLIVMALTALDQPTEDKPACVYFNGDEPLAEALKDCDTKTAEALEKAVQRAKEELKAVGAIELIKAARSGRRAEYRLTLDRKPSAYQRDVSRIAILRARQADTTCPADLTSDDGIQPDTWCPAENTVNEPTQPDTTCPAEEDTRCPAYRGGTTEEPLLPLTSFVVDADAKPPKIGKTSKSKTKPKPAKTTLPDDFSITPKMRLWAADKCPSVDIDLNTIRFCNYHTENESQFSLWERAWQNWMVKEQTSSARYPARASPAAENIAARYTPAAALDRPRGWEAA